MLADVTTVNEYMIREYGIVALRRRIAANERQAAALAKLPQCPKARRDLSALRQVVERRRQNLAEMEAGK